MVMSASKQMADLDLEELHNHDVFDFMWEDTALDTDEQMVNKQKRNKKKKKPSLFKVSFRMRNVRLDLTVFFRDCVETCNDELYFKQYDYYVAIGCSACNKASSEVRCLQLVIIAHSFAMLALSKSIATSSFICNNAYCLISLHISVVEVCLHSM
ncbi:hypothetical protein MIR68_007811 [Amoeboaphelidium protococcarum]|nr:hypothetical protein MIR68_007811 [Amoeboaphelidium protococcarum]